MIRFKQKEFFLNVALTAGSMALGAKQSADAAEQNEELASQARKDASKTRAALDRLAKSGASQETKEQAASLFSNRRMFAAPGGVLKNLGGLGKDLWNHSKGGLGKAAKLGAGFAAAGYIGNRVATSLKDHDEGNDHKTGNFLKKAALTAGAVGGSIMAAKRGYLGKGAQNFMTQGAGSKALGTAKSVLQENVNPVKRKENGKLGINGGGAMGLAFGMAPVVSYMAQRKSQGDMTEATQEDPQRQYANIGGMLGGAWKWTKGAATHLYKNPGQALTGGFNKLTNSLGMMGGKGGTEAVQRTAEKFAKSENAYTQKLGNWMKDNKKSANVLAGTAALAAGTTAMGLGEKAIKKTTKLIDRDAYKMEEQENGNI